MKKYFILLCIGMLAACKLDSTKTFRKTDYTGGGAIKILPLPKNAVPNTFCLKAAQFDGRDNLYFFNRPKYQILVYDLENQELINVIQMKKEGPDGITGFKGFTVIEKNRIMISSINRKLYTINLSGEVVDIIDYDLVGEIGEFSRAVTLAKGTNDIYRIGNKFIIPQRPAYRTSDNAINSNAEKIGKSLFIIVENHDKTFSDQKLTEDVLEGLPENASLQMTSSFRDGTVYWSFFETLDIYYSDITKKTTISKIKFPFPGEKNEKDMQDLGIFGYYSKSTLCRGLLYDHYRNNFYRMVSYGVVNPDEMYGQDIEFVARYPVKFSIFVMDKDLNPQKEVHFEGTKYDFDRYFISRDGFFLSLNNPENPDFDEDYLRFEKIDL